MSDYTRLTNFTAKDSLTTGDPEKLVSGQEIQAELDAISTAIASKRNAFGVDTVADATDVGYDNGASGLSATTTQAAIDEIAAASGSSGLFAGSCIVSSAGSLLVTNGVASSAKLGTGDYTITLDPTYFSPAGAVAADCVLFITTIGVLGTPLYVDWAFTGSNVFEINIKSQAANAFTNAGFAVLIVPII